MRESHVERYLKLRVKEEGGYCLKLRFVGRLGAPDRLVLLSKRHFLVELKAPGKKPRPSQVRMHKLLRWAGFEVYVIDNYESVEELLDGYRGNFK